MSGGMPFHRRKPAILELGVLDAVCDSRIEIEKSRKDIFPGADNIALFRDFISSVAVAFIIGSWFWKNDALFVFSPLMGHDHPFMPLAINRAGFLQETGRGYP
jgi:hypothetical protein